MNTDKHGFQAPDYICENLYPQKHFLEGKDRAGRHYIDQGPTNVSKCVCPTLAPFFQYRFVFLQ